jgi:uracil-DNA glycosylase family 4
MEFVANKILTYFFEALVRFRPDDVIVCWDRGKSRWRSELYEDYKAQRLQKKLDTDLDLEALDEQGMLVQRYLTSVGVRQVLVKGVEADDTLGWLADHFKSLPGDWDVILVTGDRDLWQLVDLKLSVWDHQRQILITPAVVEENLGVSPSRVADLKALIGDPSDNLPGVKHVGEKTASKLLNKYGSIGRILDPENASELEKRKTTARILPEGDFVGEMYRLVKLPSLREASECLSAEEHKLLVEALTAPLTRDSFRSQVLSERIGPSFLASAGGLPAYSSDLSGMVECMDQKSAQNRSWTSLKEVDQEISTCNRCPLRQECGPEGPTYPEGSSDRKIMIVGRNPGRQERENCRPFFPEAPAGALLNRFLEAAGIDRGECWVTNVNKCYSKDDRPPTYPEILSCLPYLRAEIDFLKPKMILAFGNEAMMAVTPYKSRVTKHCGEILENPEGLVGPVEAFVAICLHPSAALRSAQNDRDLEYAAKVVYDFLEKRTTT